MPLNEALQKVSKFLIDTAEQAQVSLADGWQWRDAFSFFDEAAAAPGAIKRIPEVWELVKVGLSDEQRSLLVQYIKDEYNTSNAEADAKVDALLDFIFDAEKFLRTFFNKKSVQP